MSSISVIIPTYNRSALLRECIDSILAQTIPISEIIVVNDGSTDDTVQVAQSYGNRITLMNKPNSGKAASLNLALAHCKGDCIWICDDDDIAAKDGAQNLLEALDRNPALCFVYGTFEIFEDTPAGRINRSPTYWPRKEESNVSIQFLEEMFTFQYAMMVRRSLYQQVGPFREDLIRSQDYEMALRLSRNAKSAYVPQVIFYQRHHAGVRGSSADSFSAASSLQKWLSYDQKIFTHVRDEYEIEEFTPSFARSWDSPHAHRAALIQRACVFANRSMWDEAIDNINRAIKESRGAFTPQELRLAESVLRTLLPWQALCRRPEWIAALRNCLQMNDNGRDIVTALSRPLVWHTRYLLQKGRIGDALAMLRLQLAILGIRGTLQRIFSSIFS